MKALEADTYLSTVALKAGHVRHPGEVTFELTYGCNLRCVHCFNPTHRALRKELSTGEILGVLDQLAAFGVLAVTFTGGELSTRLDLGAVLRHARRQGLIARILTNATRVTPAFVALLRETGVQQIGVSIYGARAKTYELMTAVPGSYAAFRRGLAALARTSIPVVLRMPVTTLNHHEIENCRRLAERLACQFQYCFDLMPTVLGNLAPLQYRLPAETKIAIDRKMRGGGESAPTPDTCSATTSFIDCDCGRNQFAITPYGEMNLCTAFPIPRYALRTGTVREGWEVLKQTVDQARPSDRYECLSCDVRSHCRQGRSDAWLETGDMSSCLPHFRQWAQLEQRSHVLLDPRRPA